MHPHPRKLFVCLLLHTLVIPFAHTPAASAQVIEWESGISVTGTATVAALPDLAVWTITLTDTDPDLKKAKRSNDAKLRALHELRDELGIALKDFEAGGLTIGRHTFREGPNEGELRHYRVQRTVVMHLHDLKRYDEWFEKLVQRADMELDVSFQSSRALELRKEARIAAVKAAKEKAQAMAAALDATVGRVIRLSESRDEWRSALSNTWSGPREEPADLAQGTFAPGAIEVTVSVSATFELK